MLAADKLQLQSALKQQATALKEKEFNLHHSNLSKSLLLLHVVNQVHAASQRPPTPASTALTR
jgi:hypothetical protein